MIQNRARKKRSAWPAISTCRDEIALIGDYLTNNLSEPDRAAFAAHLGACPDCSAFLATYKKTIELTRSFLRARSHSRLKRHLQLRR
ncbi:MAG TPA: zf-HC2 domain-containing protein [Candidatus Binatia bacterium]